MGILHIFERGGEEYHDYKRTLKIAKKAIEHLHELTEDMEEEYGERRSYRRGGMHDEYDERGGMR